MSFLAIALVFLQACKPSIPSQYLSKDEMEDILYEFHIAEAMAHENYDAQQKGDMIAYREAIFKSMTSPKPTSILLWCITCAIPS